MGLESHIQDSLARGKSGYVMGEHYWFEFGLKCEKEDVARDIARILNDTDEFGQATVKRFETINCWGIEFGVHKSFLR